MAFEGLAVRPPVAPMLARSRRELPVGDYLYEPKWDGFRAIVFRDSEDVEIQSRQGRPFALRFPEIVDAVRELPDQRVVVDGEILVMRDGRFDFDELMMRTHRATSRHGAQGASTPASFVAFDLLADGDRSLLEAPFAERRARLEEVVADGGTIRITAATDGVTIAARWLRGSTERGTDGVMAKEREAPYKPGKRSMIKVKLERTADCVVAGVRVFPDGSVASLLLGLNDEAGVLRHVGVSSAFSASRRFELANELAPRVVSLQGHPWESGFGLDRSPLLYMKGSAGRWHPGMVMDWMPLEPVVAEFAYTAVDNRCFRHPPHFRRWRPDRESRSCSMDQLTTE